VESEADGLPLSGRWPAVVVLSIGIVLAVLDTSIANVALPTIGRELHTDAALTIWVVNAFQIGVMITLLPFAALGDSIGYRRVYSGGLAVFTLGSLACALSHSLPLLIASRAFQGIGAAGIMSVAPALFRNVFPNRLLGQALGISALVVASSSAAGPTVGGAILAVLPWPWLFAVNVPLGTLDFFLDCSRPRRATVIPSTCRARCSRVRRSRCSSSHSTVLRIAIHRSSRRSCSPRARCCCSSSCAGNAI
jgi:DHA2 family multidrug resistance protein-like MFS transporter